MPNLTNGTNLNGTITLSKATGTKVTLDTDHKYLTKDIELTINAPASTVSSSGATVSYTSGWVNAGSTTVTDANLVAANIKKDTSIFGVTGTYEGNAVIVADTLDENGGTIRTITTVEAPVTLQSKTNITPTTSNTTVTADNGYDGLASVQVKGDANLVAANIKNGTSLFGVTGTHEGIEDIITYTVTMDSEGEEIQNITCNKTYSQILDIIGNDIWYTLINITNEYYTTLIGGQIWWNQGDNTPLHICFELYEEGVASYKIIHNSNGTITWENVPVICVLHCPTFYINLNSSNEIASITCNKTYTECSDAINEYDLYKAQCIIKGNDGGENESGVLYYHTTSGTDLIYYVFGNGAIPTMQITYASNGTITWQRNPIATRTSTNLTASGLTVTAPAGYYASDATKTLTDSNLVATNIKNGVSIFGVTGSYGDSGGSNSTSWETVYISTRDYSNDWGNGNYYVLATSWHELILQNSVWRITWDGVQYECTATWQDPEGDNYAIGNYVLDNGSGGTQYPFFMQTYNNGTELYIVTANSGYHSIIIEKQTTDTVLWETIHTGIYPIYDNENNGGYIITSCGPLQGFTQNSAWRITWNGTQYICLASQPCTLMSSDYGIGYCIGNYSLDGSNNGGNNEPFLMGVYDWHDGSTAIIIGTSATSGTATIRIERMVGNLIPKTITTNGTYNASDDGVDGYSQVIVNVSNVTVTDVTNTTGTTAQVEASNLSTPHTISLTFTDSTSTTIPVYYTDSLISTMITSYNPLTYNSKTVASAALDGVTWFNGIPLNIQLIDYTKVSSDTAIGSSGIAETQQYYYTSDYTPVQEGMTFSYTAGTWFYIGVYDANKTVLRTIYVYDDGTQDSNNTNLAHGTLSGSELTGAKYVRLCSTGGSSADDMSLIRTA